MTHLSALAILPKFLWKHIAVYLSLRDIGVNRSIAGFKTVFDDDYCKQRLLSDTTEDIIVVKTKSNNNDNFWSYALVCHQKYNCLPDLFRIIGQTKFRKFTYITVFMKAGKYTIEYNIDLYSFHNNKCSLSIIGSTSDSTIIIGQKCVTWRIQVPRCISFENIIFDTDCRVQGMTKKGFTTLTSITNCKFTNWLYIYIYDIQKLSITNCEFNRPIIMDTIAQSFVTQCTFNIKSEVTLNNVSIDFNNNIVIPKQILYIGQLVNNTIIIRNNAVSDCVTCIRFGNYAHPTKNDHILIRNNHLITKN